MNTYSITDLDGFAEHIRNGAAESIVENFHEDLNEFITLNQTKSLIMSQSLGLDVDDLYIINEDIFDKIFEDVRHFIYQSGLAKLAAKGIIECAWDNDANEMVFWANSTNGSNDHESQNS